MDKRYTTALNAIVRRYAQKHKRKRKLKPATPKGDLPGGVGIASGSVSEDGPT